MESVGSSSLEAPKPLVSKTSNRRLSMHADAFIDYGSINFTMHNTTQAAEYLLVQQPVPLSRIVDHMTDYWEIRSPGMLLRVVGAVEAGQLESVQGVLEGIVYGVSKANGCIFSNGLDFGLAAVVGNTISAARHRCQRGGRGAGGPRGAWAEPRAPDRQSHFG